MNTFAFTLDLSKTAYMEPLRIRQGDHNGTTVQATILDHGVALEGSYTARFCMRHPGTGATYYRETGTYANGVATVALDEQYAASVPGRTTAYIQLLQGSTIIASTSDIPVVILHDATEDAVPGEVYDSAIEDALAELDEATGRISVMVQEQVAEELAAHPEWTTTVQDNSLPDSKLIQSGGILSRNARLMYRLANLLTHRTDEGTLSAISDAAKTPMAGLSVYGQSTQDGTPTPEAPVAIESVEGDSEGNISLWARGRNLLHTTAPTQTVSGVTFTRNEDGSILAVGTSTATIQLMLVPQDSSFLTLPAGTYTLSGCPSGGSNTTWKLDLATRVSGTIVDTGIDFGSGSTFTLDEKTTLQRCRIVIYSGNTVNMTFRPMLASGSTATAYQPYVETVTPIDLNGHELRSLPDGTRDELTVDAEGHAVLMQRVGVVTLDGTESVGAGSTDRRIWRITPSAPAYNTGAISDNLLCDRFERTTAGNANMADGNVKLTGTSATAERQFYFRQTACATAEEFATWLASNNVEVIYRLAEPVTHDLGTVPLVPLVGPDLTAQTVPTAPFVLDAERDLNVTLARLESAIAALA